MLTPASEDQKQSWGTFHERITNPGDGGSPGTQARERLRRFVRLGSTAAF
jgi:hypothetical protein